MTTHPPVLTDPNLFDYFSARIGDVIDRQCPDLSLQVRHYLGHLLARLTKIEHLPDPTRSTTLAELHLRASGSPTGEAIRLYKQLGDHALYIGGYFSESLERRTIGVGYYADMGESAYYRLAGLTRSNWSDEGPLASLFGELARTFRDCLGVLQLVADSDRGDGRFDLARLVERWLSAGDPDADRLLIGGGLSPLGLVPGDS